MENGKNWSHSYALEKNWQAGAGQGWGFIVTAPHQLNTVFHYKRRLSKSIGFKVSFFVWAIISVMSRAERTNTKSIISCWDHCCRRCSALRTAVRDNAPFGRRNWFPCKSQCFLFKRPFQQEKSRKKVCHVIKIRLSWSFSITFWPEFFVHSFFLPSKNRKLVVEDVKIKTGALPSEVQNTPHPGHRWIRVSRWESVIQNVTREVSPPCCSNGRISRSSWWQCLWKLCPALLLCWTSWGQTTDPLLVWFMPLIFLSWTAVIFLFRAAPFSVGRFRPSPSQHPPTHKWRCCSL